jgi:hypothetical protein
MSSNSSACAAANNFSPAPTPDITCLQEPNLAAGSEPLPQAVPMSKLKPWSGVDGVLHRVVQAGERYIIAYVGKICLVLPDEPLRTKGGKIDLRDWIGQKVGLRNAGSVLCVRLMPYTEEDRLQLRVWELETVLSGMIGHFANRHDDGCYYSGDTAALKQAFSHLGLQEGCTAQALLACCKDAAAKEARARAEASVSEGRA